MRSRSLAWMLLPVAILLLFVLRNIGVAQEATPVATPAATPTAGLDGGMIPDLAALIPVPDELEIDVPTLGYARSAFLISPQEAVRNVSRYRGLDGPAQAEMVTIYEEAGFLAGLDLSYITFDEDGVRDGTYTFSIEVYRDAAGAAQAFPLLEASRFEAKGSSDLEEVPAIGNEAEVTVNILPGDEQIPPSRDAEVTFRVDNLIARVNVTAVDPAGTGATPVTDATPVRAFATPVTNATPVEAAMTPLAAEAERLARVFLDRIEQVGVEGGPSLSLRALRLSGAGIRTNDDAYRVQNGVILPLRTDPAEPAEREATQARRLAEFGGAIDVFHHRQDIPDPAGDTLVFSRVFRFADAAAAEAFVADFARQTGETSSSTSIVERDDAPSLGDESAAFALSTERSDGTRVGGQVVLMRFDDVVAEVRVNSPRETDPAVVDALAEAQAACLTTEGLCEPVPVPATLVEPLTSAATPAATPESTT